jgi:hypothetical protein
VDHAVGDAGAGAHFGLGDDDASEDVGIVLGARGGRRAEQRESETEGEKRAFHWVVT